MQRRCDLLESSTLRNPRLDIFGGQNRSIEIDERSLPLRDGTHVIRYYEPRDFESGDTLNGLHGIHNGLTLSSQPRHVTALDFSPKVPYDES
jgi:hypothetical protein